MVLAEHASVDRDVCYACLACIICVFFIACVVEKIHRTTAAFLIYCTVSLTLDISHLQARTHTRILSLSLSLSLPLSLSLSLSAHTHTHSRAPDHEEATRHFGYASDLICTCSALSSIPDSSPVQVSCPSNVCLRIMFIYPFDTELRECIYIYIHIYQYIHICTQRAKKP